MKLLRLLNLWPPFGRDTTPTDLSRAAASLIRFTATASGRSGALADASNRVVFRAFAKAKGPDVVFADNYLGRFQVGQLVAVGAFVRDSAGVLTPPTAAPPTATVYRLDDRTRVARVEAYRVRESDGLPLYTAAVTLGREYAPGRYAVLVRSPTGGFTGYETWTFDVDGGGDGLGPVIAAFGYAFPAGDVVMAHLGSGRVLAARDPYAE